MGGTYRAAAGKPCSLFCLGMYTPARCQTFSKRERAPFTNRRIANLENEPVPDVAPHHVTSLVVGRINERARPDRSGMRTGKLDPSSRRLEFLCKRRRCRKARAKHTGCHANHACDRRSVKLAPECRRFTVRSRGSLVGHE